MDEFSTQSDPTASVAARVRAALVQEVPSELAARHLEMMTGGAPVASVTSVTPVAWRQWTRRRVVAVAVAAALSVVLMGGSAVAASSDALPGDLLYGVKRAAERVDLALHGGSSAKAKLHLKFAGRRLTELAALLERRRAGESVDVAAAMRAYREEVAHVESDAAQAALDQNFEALLDQIIDNLQQHVDRLTYLRDNQVPEQAREAIQRAIDNAQTAQDRVGRGRGQAGDDHGKPSESPGRSGNAPGRAP